MPALDRAKTIQAAEKFVKAGKLAEAVKEYQKLADDNPRDMNVMNKLGDLLVRAGKNSDALKHFVRIADYYGRDGFHLKAIAMYKKVCKLDPTNIDSQQRLAVLYVQQGLQSDARAQYVQLADHFHKKNQPAEAAEALRQVLEIDPENLKVRLALAESLMKSSKADEAAREYCLVARSTAARGAVNETIEVLRRAVQASPALPGLPGLLLGVVTRIETAPAPLVSAAEEVVQHAARSALAHVVLGESLRRAGRAAEAAAAFRKAVGGQGIDDDLNAESLMVLSRGHDEANQTAEAWEMLERAVARAEPATGHQPAALLDEFLGRHPDHRQALTARAEEAARGGDAEAEAQALVRLAPILMASGSRDRGQEVLRRLTTLRPGDPAIERLQRDAESGAAAVAPPSAAATPAAAPPASAARPVAPAAAAALPARIEEEEIEVVLVEEEEPGASATRAEEETRSAEEIFNLEDESGAVDIELEAEVPSIETAAPVAKAPTEAVAGDSLDADESLYGPDSRIQEIQSADVDGRQVDEEFISEHLTEAEVFVKYGLHEKAREQLQAILERYPRHEAARLRLKDILLAEGNKDGAIRECIAVAGHLREMGRDAEARELLNEAVRIDPDSPLVERQRGPEPPLRVVPAPVVAPKAPKAVAGSAGGSAKKPPSARDLEIDLDLDEEAAASNDVGVTTARTILSSAPKRDAAEAEDDLPAPAAKPAGRAAKKRAPATGPAGSEGAFATPVALPSEPDDEKLGEVDFYIEQGLVEEARQVLFQLGKQHPGSAAVASRLKRLEQPHARPAAPAPPEKPAGETDLDFEVEQALAGKASTRAPAPPAKQPRAAAPKAVFKLEKPAAEPAGDDDFFDLGAEISRSLVDDQPDADGPIKETLDGQAHSFEDIFAAFKKGVEQQVDSDDYETHYNLGIAYKEMGLVDEAIGEFQFAAKDPGRTLECCGILGLCFRDKGMPDLALKWYRRGLDMPNLDDRQALGLRYDIAEIHRDRGEFDQALRAYTEVFGVDSTYRDVSSRIKEMKSALSGAAR